MKSYIKSLISKLGALFNRTLISSIEKISDNLTSLRMESLYNSLKYKEDHRILINFEEQVFSQNGEDGIISEIFDRIGIDSSIFVEMGVGDGLENNTSFLLLQGWSGFWLEGNKKNVNKINEGFRKLIKDKKLIVKETFIKKETINSDLDEAGVPKVVDLLSIDIDGNDYWVIDSLKCDFRPRVIVVEYNAGLGKSVKFTPCYEPDYIWDGSNYMGASLSAINELLNNKGYQLVGCNLTGANAFFVQKELVKDKFYKPGNLDFHYETPKYNSMLNRVGHKKRSYKFFESL